MILKINFFSFPVEFNTIVLYIRVTTLNLLQQMLNRLLALFTCLTVTIVFAQNDIGMVVKINYSCLDFNVINDKEQLTIPLKHLLNERGNDALKNLLVKYPDLKDHELTKLFPFLTTKDTVSISRTGERISIPPFWATFLMSNPKGTNQLELMTDLDKQTKLIDYIHPDYLIEFASTPNDSLYHKQHSLNESISNAHINVEEAWEMETGEPFIKVAVHDNGIDSLHEDIDVLFGGGYNGADYPEDNWGTFGPHGTPVAGIIGAKRNNSIGIAGIAGGDGTGSSGVRLIDTKFSFGQSISASYFMAAVVDAARAVGTYWDYPSPTSASEYYNQAPGFGVHIGNHSYVIRTDLPRLVEEGKTQDEDNTTSIEGCTMCREAFLFSLRNGVINVVARGNRASASPSSDPQFIEDLFPQQLPDGWIISVGASSYDGTTVQEGINQTPTEVGNNYYSLYGGNMDLIAPGSDSIVYTIKTNQYNESLYTKFNGTSAAAPHVSGVVGLLLSHYNKACYSNRNLAIEDVEYILEHSTVELNTPGYDNLTGWGRLDAGAALKMIEHPVKQIVHPDSVLVSEAIAIDTIALGYREALTAADWGPISTPWPLERNKNYQVVRVLVENTYDISMFIGPTTEILDYWALPSSSNSTKHFEDTIRVYDPYPLGFVDTTFLFDVFDLTPHDTIVAFDTANMTVKTQGYYYHFINRYKDKEEVDFNEPWTFGPDSFNIDLIVDYWYPINPYQDRARLPFSIYLQDSTLAHLYDFPCDSTTALYDEEYYEYLDLEKPKTDNIAVYPNPFSTEVSIVFGNLMGEKDLSISHINGKVVDAYTTQENSHTLQTTGLSNGMYLLTCIVQGESKTFKILKR